MRFDLTAGCVVARVVYDGSGSTGKTTNVTRLASSFRAVAAGEATPPLELCGRTMYFDWMTLRAGHVYGFPLICEVLTVPGQPELAARRAHVLAGADAVVHVCDAGRDALEETRANLAWTRARIAPELPLVLQANKQDEPGAMSGAELVAALAGLAGGEVVEAIARDGIGVVDTFLRAVRALTRSLEADEGGRVEVTRGGGAIGLRETLEALPVDRAWLAELALENAASALASIERPRPTLAERAERAPPPLPGPTVPPGHVWPARLGRTVLAKLAASAAYARASVPTETPIEIDGWELFTSSELRFEDGEAARASLVRRAREHAQLQRTTEGDAILVLARAADEALWLWTLRPLRGVAAPLELRGQRARGIERGSA